MKPEGWNLALSKTLLLSKVLGKLTIKHKCNYLMIKLGNQYIFIAPIIIILTRESIGKHSRERYQDMTPSLIG